jgi:signal transduction histidine kinase
MRLILSVTLAMVVTHVLVLLALAEMFSREQRADRAAQMARLLAFIKPRMEAVPELPLDQPLSPPSFERSHRLKMAEAAQMPALAPSSAQFKDNPPVDYREQGQRPPLRELPTMMLTKNLPDGEGDVELLTRIREVVPEVVRVAYTDLAPWPGLGPERWYRIESWTRLSNGLYLQMVVEATAQPGERRFEKPSAFATIDIGLRIAVGVLLALLIMGWISKPLARLTDSVDATLPSGELKPGVAPFRVEDAPTEIAHTLAAIERMRQRIGAMVAERTTMLTALAHDLRTPLTRLMLRLELATDTQLRADANRDCQKMQTLISRTLDFIRSSEAGVSIVAVDVSTLVARICAALPSADATRVRHGTALGRVYASEWGLERALANLIDNALKHTPPIAAVEIHCAQHGEMTHVIVRDHGRGVPAAALQLIKQPFYRADTARNIDDGGVGLGLSIVDNLARAYGGEMQIYNHPEGGLVVTLVLPRAPRSPDDDEKVES